MGTMRTTSAGWDTRITTCAAAAMIAALGCTAVATAGDIFFETHTFTHHVTAPEAGQMYQESIALPKFDTMGGTRSLLGFIEAYGPVDDSVILGTATIADNNSTEDNVGSRVRWGLEWTGEIGGQQFLPAHSDFGGGPYSILGSKSHWSPPETSGFTTEAGGGVSLDRTVTDPVKLATLTGSGTVDLTMKLNMGDFAYEPLEPPFAPKGTVFDPDFVTIEWESFDLQVTIRYMYQSVPAPGSLALLGLSGLGVRRRRRH